MASIFMPSSMLPVIQGENAITDNWIDPFVRTFLSNSNGEEVDTSDDYILENGYLYVMTSLRAGSAKGKTFHDYFEFGQYAGDLSSINQFEYKDPTDNQWKDARSAFETNQHTFVADKDSNQCLFRMNFTSDLTFTFKYYLSSTDGTVNLSTNKRFIRIENDTAVFTQKENNVTTTISTTPAPTTTEAPTTTVEPTAEPTTVAPTSTVEISTKTTTPAQTTTKATTTPAQTTTKATTTKATTTPAQTTTKNITTTPKTTTVPVTTTQAKTTTIEETTSVGTATSVTSSGATDEQLVNAPGKVTIKKVGKKKLSAKKLKVTLKAVSGAKGYQISVYKNKKNANKHIKAIVTKYTTKVKYTIKSKKLKKKKKLFVGARAFNLAIDGAKQFGPWAKIKKVKVK